MYQYQTVNHLEVNLNQRYKLPSKSVWFFSTLPVSSLANVANLIEMQFVIQLKTSNTIKQESQNCPFFLEKQCNVSVSE